jgi:hypothetical protein
VLVHFQWISFTKSTSKVRKGQSMQMWMTFALRLNPAFTSELSRSSWIYGESLGSPLLEMPLVIFSDPLAKGVRSIWRRIESHNSRTSSQPPLQACGCSTWAADSRWSIGQSRQWPTAPWQHDMGGARDSYRGQQERNHHQPCVCGALLAQ